MNVLLIRTDRIGEVLLSTVAIDAVRGRYPEASVTFVTSEYSREIIDGRDDIAEVITADTFARGGWLAEAVRLARELKKRHFDVSVVMNPHKGLHLACFLAGIPRRIGYDRKWPFLLTERILDERGRGEKHEIEYTMDLLRLFDAGDASVSPRLPVDKKAESEVQAILAGKNIPAGRPVVAVHPGSSNPSKIWPPEHYAGLIRRIKTELDCGVCILGVEAERPLAEEITAGSDSGALNFAGELNLKELAALLKRADLFIGNDTGPMHMAAALGVPVIAIFGRNIPGVSPRRWRPWGECHVVFHEATDCDTCYDAACPYDYRCLRMITPDAVFEAAKEKLKGGTGSPQ